MTKNGQRSDPLTIKQGVPKASVLRPILFPLFVNDTPLRPSRSSIDIFRWWYNRRTASTHKGKEKKKERGRKEEKRKYAMVALLRDFPKIRTGRPDHGRTSHFENEIVFFQEFLPKNHLLCACYLGFDWSGWNFFFTGIKSVTTGMAWPVISDKWKAPLVFIVATSEILARLNNCWTEIVLLAVTFSKIRRDIFFEVCRCIFRLDQHFHVIHVRQYRVVKFLNLTSLIFTLQASRIIVSCMFICCRELQLVINYCQRVASRRRGAARRQLNNKPCAKWILKRCNLR